MCRGVFLRVALLVAGTGVALQAFGAPEQQGFYVGGGFGSSNVSVSDSYDNTCCDYTYRDGDADTAVSVHVGYRFMPFLAVEVGYLDSGQPRWNENYLYIGELGDTFNVSVDFKKLEATEVSALGILPFGSDWEAYMRVGVAYWSANVSQVAIGTFSGALVRGSVNKNDAAFLLGFGAGVTPLRHWHFRIELQTYSIDKDLLGGYGSASTDTVLLEAQYRFRG